MAVSKRLRFEIFRRDEHKCRYCGRTAPEVKITIDHVVPETLGGSDDPSNLVTACADCNGGKSSVPADAPLVQDVADKALAWAEALRIVADERALQRARSSKYYYAFQEVWDSWKDWRGNAVPLPGGWKSSIDQLLSAGLHMDDLIELIDVAMGARAKDEWKYFCGCCWKRLSQIQERAAEIIAADDVTGPATPAVTTCWTWDDVGAALDEAEDMAGGLDDLHRRSCRHVTWAPDGPWHCGDAICVMEYATHLTNSAVDWHFAESERNQRDQRLFNELDELELADG